MNDRARRRTIICRACGQPGTHRGHGWCYTCYARWHYHGRPVGGPPAPGAIPRQVKPRPVPEFCYRGHRLDDTNLRYDCRGVRLCRSCRLDVERAYNEKKFTERHDGHDVIPTTDGRRYCRTCNTGAHDVDEIAVERAAGGEPPARLTAAEREAAVLQLHGKGLTYEVIAQRVGCHLRTVYAVYRRNGLTKPRRTEVAA